jgi:putative MATE family efflux protein
MHKDLTQGPIYSKLISMSFSMMWGLLSIIGFNLADTYFIAQLGKSELASVTLCYPIILFFFSIALGLSTAVSSIVSRSIGKKDNNEVRRYTSDALTLALLVVLISIILGFILLKPTLMLLGANSETLPIATQYLSIWFSGMFFLTVPMVGNGVIRANGSMKVASFIMIVGAVINITLDPILIFGFGDIPGMGVSGAAYATVISRAMTLAASLWFLHFKYQMIDFHRPAMNIAIKSWKKILAIGIPAMGTNLLSPLGMIVVTALITRVGDNEIAAYGIVNKIESFAFIFVLALSSAFSPIVGQSLGACKYERVSKVVKGACIMSILWGSFIGIILYFISPWIMDLFISDTEIKTIGVKYLTLVPITYGLYGIRIIASSFFNAIGKPFQATFIGVVHFIILFIPFVYLGNHLSGISGIFIGHCLTYIMIGIISICMMKKYINLKLGVKIE